MLTAGDSRSSSRPSDHRNSPPRHASSLTAKPLRNVGPPQRLGERIIGSGERGDAAGLPTKPIVRDRSPVERPTSILVYSNAATAPTKRVAPRINTIIQTSVEVVPCCRCRFTNQATTAMMIAIGSTIDRTCSTCRQ